MKELTVTAELNIGWFRDVLKIEMEKAVSKVIILTALLCIGFLSVYSQNKPKAILVDEYANVFCSEEVRARLDQFIIELQNKPGSTGYITGHADSKIPGRFYKYWRTTQNHIIKNRNQSPERFTFHRGEDKDSMNFQLWMIPPGGSNLQLPNEYKTDHITTKTLFDKSSISSIKGKEVFFGFESDEPCDWGLDLAEYAKVLNNDPTLRGLLSIFPGKASNGKKINSTKALDLTIKILVNVHKVERNRLSFSIKDKKEFAEMELWLIPSL